jgi:hypothetical protein
LKALIKKFRLKLIGKGRAGLLFLIALVSASAVYSQQAEWKAGVFSFFDNVEFGKSAVKIPQTMAGVIVVPELGLKWDTLHSVHLGVSMLHEFGSLKVIDKTYPEAYYCYNGKPVFFVMGAFPRKMAVQDYPRLFFQDSLSYYRPLMNGMIVKYGEGSNYIELWLDWTGRQSLTVHEAFFLGISGRYNFGIFNVKHFGYYYHFAAKMNPVIDEALHDNGLFLTSAGIDLSGRYFPGKLECDAGWVIGLERARADNTGWHSMNGVMVNARAEYRFLGLSNSFYAGDGQMKFYRDHGNDLYWGDPVYRARVTDRADIYIAFIKSKYADLEMTYSLHFLEGRVYNEQMLKLKIDISGNIGRGK